MADEDNRNRMETPSKPVSYTQVLAAHNLKCICVIPKDSQKRFYDTFYYKSSEKDKLWMIFADNFDSDVFGKLHFDVQNEMFKTLKDKPKTIHHLRCICDMPIENQKIFYDTLFHNKTEKESIWMNFAGNLDPDLFRKLHFDIQNDMFQTLKDKPEIIAKLLKNIRIDRFRCFQMLDCDRQLDQFVQNAINACNARSSSHFLNRMYMLCLLNLAKRHINQENRLTLTRACNVLYRDRPKEDLDKIMQADGHMRVLPKNSGYPIRGDPYSPINHKLEVFRPKGLFFASSVSKDDTPRKTSPYGDFRLSIPIKELLDHVNNGRIYFADFYSMGGLFQYVTLVVTKPSSAQTVQDVPVDKWCSNNLIRLSTTGQKLAKLSPDVQSGPEQSNPFLFYDTSARRWMTCAGVWVHVFYTEDIDISSESLDRMGATISPMEIPEKPRNQWKPREDRFQYDVRGFGFDSPVYDNPGHGYGYPGYGRTGYCYPGYRCTGYGYSGYGSTGNGYPRYSSPGRGKSGYKMVDEKLTY